MSDLNLTSSAGSSLLVRWAAFLFALFLGLNIGGALLATTTIFPVWSEAPAAAVAWDSRINEARFFGVVAPAAMLLALVSFGASWRAAPGARVWLRVSAILYATFFAATMIYFVPEQAAMKGAAGAQLPPGELALKLERWVTLNWFRQLLGLTALASALHALGLSYRTHAIAADAPDTRSLPMRFVR